MLDIRAFFHKGFCTVYFGAKEDNAVTLASTFIQTRVKKIEDMATIIVLGSLVYVMVEIAPDIYGPCVSNGKKGVKTLILRCHNAIY